ncbi:MAG: hypothetical protein RL274_2688 [Pseudomonadota bacterium]
MPSYMGGFSPVLLGFHTVQHAGFGRQSLPYRQLLPAFLWCQDRDARKKRSEIAGLHLAHRLLQLLAIIIESTQCELHRHPIFPRRMQVIMRRSRRTPTRRTNPRRSRSWWRPPRPRRRSRHKAKRAPTGPRTTSPGMTGPRTTRTPLPGAMPRAKPIPRRYRQSRPRRTARTIPRSMMKSPYWLMSQA